MQKILNDPERFVDEMLEGIVAAHPAELRRAGRRGDRPRRRPGRRQGRRSRPAAARATCRCSWATSGEGLLDGAAIGDVFASPRADQMLEVTRAVSGGARRAVPLRQLRRRRDELRPRRRAGRRVEGIEVRTVLGADDVASAPPERADRRRGIAGIFFLYKVAGAAAAEGALAGRGRRASPSAPPTGCGRWASRSRRARSRRPASRRSSCPTARWRSGWASTASRASAAAPLETADRIADELVDAILADLPWPAGDAVAVLVNGLGATPKEELYILYRRVARRASTAQGLAVHRVWVGEYATSLEMAGASVSPAAARRRAARPRRRTRSRRRSSSRRERAGARPTAGSRRSCVAIAAALVEARDELNRLDGVGRRRRPRADGATGRGGARRASRPTLADAGAAGRGPGDRDGARPPGTVDRRHAHRVRAASPRPRSSPAATRRGCRPSPPCSRRPATRSRHAARSRPATGRCSTRSRRPRRRSAPRRTRAARRRDGARERGRGRRRRRDGDERHGRDDRSRGLARRSSRAATRTRARGSSRSCSPPRRRQKPASRSGRRRQRRVDLVPGSRFGARWIPSFAQPSGSRSCRSDTSCST